MEYAGRAVQDHWQCLLRRGGGDHIVPDHLAEGHILIDSGFAETVPLIKANVEKLGFKLSDIKILLNTQAHYDHAAGLNELKKLTGAKMLASAATNRSSNAAG